LGIGTPRTAAPFDREVARKMGEPFGDVFLPVMKQLVQAGSSYERVKRAVGIPSRWAAKITGESSRAGATAAIQG
jgi:hypothetical protein